MEITYLHSSAARRLGSGRVIGNDSGVITRRNPDSVRGPDVAYHRMAKVLAEDHKRGYPTSPPDLVVEVRSISDRWADILEAVAEYLAAGLLIIEVLDPDQRSAYLFEADQAPRVLGPEDTLAFPALLGDFAVLVSRIFG